MTGTKPSGAQGTTTVAAAGAQERGLGKLAARIGRSFVASVGSIS